MISEKWQRLFLNVRNPIDKHYSIVYNRFKALNCLENRQS